MARTLGTSGIVSLRLSPEERKLVEEAAAKKNWKVAHFLRVSALDRAVHIVNLSRPTSFDFGGLARRAAQALVAERAVELYDQYDGRIGRFKVGSVNRAELDEKFPAGTAAGLDSIEFRQIDPPGLTKADAHSLAEAVRLGGLEFAEQLLLECRRLVMDSSDPSLPPPIDPANLQQVEVEEGK